MVISDKKAIQKKRMITYFLDATLEIIEKEGIEKVTVRKIADIAGYNSATLYNYFESLDHLLFYAAMSNMNDYINALPIYTKYVKNSRDLYFEVWRCFIEYSFLKPEIYYNLFFSSLKEEMDVYIKHYYSLFPIDVKNYNDTVRVMLNDNNISSRSKVLINACVDEGYFTREDGYLIDDLVLLIYESMLMRVYLKTMDAGSAKELLLNYIETLFKKLRV